MTTQPRKPLDEQISATQERISKIKRDVSKRGFARPWDKAELLYEARSLARLWKMKNG